MKHLTLILIAILSVGCQDNSTTMKKEFGTIEVVTFRMKDGITIPEAQTQLEKLNDCVRQFDGFIERKLSVNEEGVWMDIVSWTTNEAAQLAAEKVMQDPVALHVFDLIDESTMSIQHYQIKNYFTH